MWLLPSDSTLSFMRDPYRYISKRCQNENVDIFQDRMLLEKSYFMMGEEAAQLFYDNEKFVRAGAAPEPIRATLFGKGGVQGLDGEMHKRRKQLFMSFMSKESVERIARLTDEWFSLYVQKWAKRSDRIILYDEVQEILTGAAFAWVGIPLDNDDIGYHAKYLAAMFDYAAQFGFNLKHFYSRYARMQEEAWITKLVEETRKTGQPISASGGAGNTSSSPFESIVWHRDANGELMEPRIAAVEIINLLRPIVAIAVDIVFVAHALHANPEMQERVLANEEKFSYFFVQEVRRLYPFFPILVARVKDNFEWKGQQFTKGMQVILDIYGTNHDPRCWENPDEFRPDRFQKWDNNPFNFIPQGGGDYFLNHRCPGEAITIKIMEVALNCLVKVNYQVPSDQDLTLEWSRLPGIPKSRFIIQNVNTIGHSSNSRQNNKEEELVSAPS
jgi:fatty-acid peroxygenase